MTNISVITSVLSGKILGKFHVIHLYVIHSDNVCLKYTRDNLIIVKVSGNTCCNLEKWVCLDVRIFLFKYTHSLGKEGHESIITAVV